MIPFLLLFGIASDGLGFVSLALFNPVRGTQLAAGMLIVAAGWAVAAGLRRRRVRSFWPYLLGAGTLSWLGLFWSGVHPALARVAVLPFLHPAPRGPGTLSWWGRFWSGLHPGLALVPVMPFLPHAPRDPGFFVDAPPDAKDALSRFELWWRYPGQIALFLFVVVNAGVPMGAIEEGVWALPIAVVVAKPLGVLAGTGLAMVIGLHLPHRIGWRDLFVGGRAL